MSTVSTLSIVPKNVTVEQLRKGGWKVRVIHQRERGKFIRSETTASSHVFGEKYIHEKSTKGGRTIVETRTPDGREIRGEAICSPNDNYNKKIGVKIALGRALKTLQG